MHEVVGKDVGPHDTYGPAGLENLASDVEKGFGRADMLSRVLDRIAELLRRAAVLERRAGNALRGAQPRLWDSRTQNAPQGENLIHGRLHCKSAKRSRKG